MYLQLEAMALNLPHVPAHPNRLPFQGVLTLVGVASQRSPTGARGHRVMLTRPASEEALPSLLGMALDYARRSPATTRAARSASLPKRPSCLCTTGGSRTQPVRSPSAATCSLTIFLTWCTRSGRKSAIPWACLTRLQTPASPIRTRSFGRSPVSPSLGPRCCVATRPPIRKLGLR